MYAGEERLFFAFPRGGGDHILAHDFRSCRGRLERHKLLMRRDREREIGEGIVSGIIGGGRERIFDDPASSRETVKFQRCWRFIL